MLLENAIRKIALAANNGKYSVAIYDRMWNDALMRVLENKGFNINDTYNQGEDVWEHTVCWK